MHLPTRLPYLELCLSEHELFIEDVEGLRDSVIVPIEGGEEFLGLPFRDFEEQALRGLHVIGRNEQMRIIRGDLHNVVAIADLLPLFVEDDPILIKDVSLLDHISGLAYAVPSHIEGGVHPSAASAFQTAHRQAREARAPQPILPLEVVVS